MKTAHAIVALVMLIASSGAAADRSLDQWLQHQVAVNTWSASVTQTRQLKSLVQPLISHGSVTFARPQRFRWQLGDPPRTVAIGSATELLIAYPRLQQLERYPHGDIGNPALRQVIDLLEVGFPSDVTAFYERYELLEAGETDRGQFFSLRPTSKEARKVLASIRLEVDADLILVASEFHFPDGSVIRNDFSDPVIDGPVDDAAFDIGDTQGWTVSAPLSR